MLALELEKSAVKEFMGKLLRGDLFCEFDARMVEVLTDTRITFDGSLENEKSGFAAWSVTRPLVYEIIKLRAKPRQIKIIFSHSRAREIHTNAAALFLNLVYENDGVSFTTATAQKEFVLEKSLDSAWDAWVREFFSRAGIAVADRT